MMRLRASRKRLRTMLLLLIVITLCYSAFVEPRMVTIKRQQVILPRLPESYNGLRVVQLSDFHFPNLNGPVHYREIVEMTNNLHPDLIVLNGDYVTSTDHARDCAQILGRLHAPLGVFAVLGNHDYRIGADPITEAFSRAGIVILRNQAHQLTRDSAHLWIVGVDDFCAGKSNLVKGLEGVPTDAAKILLIHEPDFADIAARHPIDLQLSGHSHGGQMRLPGIGGLYYTNFGSRYPKGLYRVGNMQIYTNPGIGQVFPLRFDCRPEITLLTLRNRPATATGY